MTTEDRLTQLATDPAVAYFITTVYGRLAAGVVDGEIYIAETRETLERKRNAIGEALLAGELQDDQARHSTQVADAQLVALDLLQRAWLDGIVDRLKAGELIAGKSMSDREFLAPLLEDADDDPSYATSMRQIHAAADADDEERFQIQVGLTGDSATAATVEAALAAADTLCHDADQLGIQGRLEAARRTVIITENGTYAGIYTELARLGSRSAR